MIDPIARMQNAQRLLEDDMLNEAFAAVEGAILAQLKGPATPNDADLLMAMRLVPKIKGWIIGQAQTGKVELAMRDAEQKAKS